jgi:hypothetical protein
MISARATMPVPADTGSHAHPGAAERHEQPAVVQWREDLDAACASDAVTPYSMGRGVSMCLRDALTLVAAGPIVVAGRLWPTVLVSRGGHVFGGSRNLALASRIPS